MRLGHACMCARAHAHTHTHIHTHTHTHTTHRLFGRFWYFIHCNCLALSWLKCFQISIVQLTWGKLERDIYRGRQDKKRKGDQRGEKIRGKGKIEGR